MILKNGRVITQDKDRPYIEDGAVVIEGNKIIAVDTTENILAKYKEEDIIDVDGKVIMPGFINTHHHIYSAFARGMASSGKPNENFLEILENLWWKIDKKLSLEDLKYSAYTTYIDCIKKGVTTVFDHNASPFAVTGSLDSIADAAKDLGLRTCLCYEVSDRDGEKIAQEGIDENIKSPTFNYVLEYLSGRLPLYHFDVYRLGEAEEIYEVGYEDYLNSNGILLIEWANIIESELPKEYVEVKLNYHGEDTREVELRYIGNEVKEKEMLEYVGFSY